MKYVYAVFLLLGFARAFAVPFEIAGDNYANQKYELAYQQFMELAALGNKRAQYNIGVMYLKGQGLARSYEDAYAWIKLSASAGDEESQATVVKLKEVLSDEVVLGGEEKYQSLQKTYSDAAIEGELAPSFENSDVVSNNRNYLSLRKLPLNYPDRALREGRMGGVTLEYTIAEDGRVKYPELLVSTGSDFTEASLDVIKKFLYAPAYLGDTPVATYAVKMRFTFALEGRKVNERKIKKLLNSYKEKAQLGAGYDQYEYGLAVSVLNRYLPEKKQNLFDNPNASYFKSAVNGFSPAKYALGSNILYGEQCTSEFDKSFFWLNSAANDGLSNAQMLLGLERLNGMRCERDIDEGLSWLKKASEKYDPAKLEYAVALVKYVENFDREEVVRLVERVDQKEFEDKLSLYEAQVLVYRAVGDKDREARSIEEFKKESKRLELPFDQLMANIERTLKGETVVPLSI